MPVKRMLVDAIHPEETRVVVTAGNKLEEFDFESATRRQLRGNIYLAKVTRVEPSLQAAFVDYGGNRHGFLAFSEIHPDYYQIPVADREALLRQAEQEEQAEQEAEDAAAGDNQDELAAESANGADAEDDEEAGSGSGNGNGASNVEEAPNGTGSVESVGAGDALEEVVERRRPTSLKRTYKIQEVIKRRQVMLVQVVKEERGNKGAALTTYLSLAGRYSVLMPNTARGGGISRKITSAADRKRLKEIVGELEVPPGQGVILRTAGATRTKAEVKRDFEYLQRLWENVRTLTLRSQAPCLVYEEGSLIKRAIRDLYNKDIAEVLVAGEEAYREAKDFMKMIMPSHAKNVQLYKDDQPIFSRYGVESQLDQMFSQQVNLPSGGYLVINPTEALVSIDVNSGRSTKEHNIEDTALQTNLEAAEEVARQLRLRDLAGLIVIDFIDMAENRANRAVERRLKEALKNDRARIQVGRISHFGLLEMSRQRIRFGVVESSTHTCPVCQGTGIVRSTESVALMVMRAIEDHVLRKPGQSISVKMPTDVALYLLNCKRPSLGQLEAKYSLTITVAADDHLIGHHYLIERGEPRNGMIEPRPGEHVRVDSAVMDEFDETEPEHAESQGEGESSRRRRRRRRGRNGERVEELEPRNAQPAGADAEDEEAPDEEGAEASNGSAETTAAETHADGEPRRRRRRGRRGGRRNRHLQEEFEAGHQPADGLAAAAEAETNEESASEPAEATHEPVEATPEPATAEPVASESGMLAHSVAAQAEPAPQPARRSRRRKPPAEPVAEAGESPEAGVASGAEAEAAAPQEAEEAPKRARGRGRRKAAPAAAPEGATESPAPAPAAGTAAAEPASDQPSESPAPAEVNGAADKETAHRRRRKALPDEGIVVSSSAAEEAEPRPKKAGWWQRGFFGS